MTQRTRTSKALEAKAGQGGEGSLLFSGLAVFGFLGLGSALLFFSFCFGFYSLRFVCAVVQGDARG